jgi:hypothetical protein
VPTQLIANSIALFTMAYADNLARQAEFSAGQKWLVVCFSCAPQCASVGIILLFQADAPLSLQPILFMQSAGWRKNPLGDVNFFAPLFALCSAVDQAALTKVAFD